ncbi:MAG TPA: SpoIID/LytB domain-containing protein [Capillimicrobium sp.]|nr:SpoIID/LytB domain-containing protein [Capillimicrobium sp.]
MRRTAPLIAVAAALAAAPAGAAATLTINGAGFGHGIGMSQYGAAGMAKEGWDHQRILAHFFQGTEIGQAPEGTVVRVLLQSPQTARFTNATNAGTKKLDPASTYGARASGDQVALLNERGRAIARFKAPMRVTNADDAPIKLLGTAGNGVPNGTYRGWFEFRPGSMGEVLAINAVGLEQYVAGVIANEAIPSWPAAALRAQAVAARGYAITTSRGGENGWDQYPDTRSQVYRGVVGEHPNTNKAVNATAGQVVTYEGEPITSYFFSTSGGHTENIENVWSGAEPQPYLRGVPDPFDDASPYHRWGPIRMSRAAATAKLGSLVKGRLKGIRVTRRGASPRVVRAVVVGTGGNTTVTGDQLRSRFGLRDTWMSFNAATAEVEVPAETDAPAPGGDKPGGGKPGGQGGSDSGGATIARAGLRGPRVVGSAYPAAPGTSVILQRRTGDRWTRVGETRLGTTRRYKVGLPGPGRYRIVVGDAPGPIVRLR